MRTEAETMTDNKATNHTNDRNNSDYIINGQHAITIITLIIIIIIIISSSNSNTRAERGNRRPFREVNARPWIL